VSISLAKSIVISSSYRFCQALAHLIAFVKRLFITMHSKLLHVRLFRRRVWLSARQGSFGLACKLVRWRNVAGRLSLYCSAKLTYLFSRTISHKSISNIFSLYWG
jgi:hypothetical protein